MQIEIFSDIACPWCYIGKRRFEEALTRFAHRDAVSVVWRSYELSPDMPAEVKMSSVEYLVSKGIPEERVRAMIAQCGEAAASVGIEMRSEGVKRFNTRKGHELLHFARAAGRQDAMAERLFRANFTEGQWLSRIDVLVALAGEAGLDVDDARAALEQGRYTADVIADEQRAQAIGVSGVPFFVLGDKYAISGGQSPEYFLHALETLWREGEPERQAQASQACASDGCAL
ncbi:DsbA family oxidoreductase [Sphingomonas cavernae]|nr:DsbA family oxidoreductase [Sphingomonas cavernae]